MSDLINRSHLIDNLIIAEAIQRVNGDEATAKAVAITIKIVEKAPTIDPESLRAKGVWEPRRDVIGFVRCSVCKDCNIYEDWAGSNKWNYCPNCGAKMEG